VPIEHVDLAAAEAAAVRDEELQSLPELFMEATRLWPHAAPGLRRRVASAHAPPLRDVLRQSCKTYASSPRIPLPDPRTSRPAPGFDDVAAPAAEMVAGSGAEPSFPPGSISPADLSRLLYHAAGRDGGAGAVPSAGGLHPLELYVLATDVRGVAAGVYHFNAWLHCLEALEECATGELRGRLGRCLPLAEGHDGAGAAVVVTATPARVCAVHGDRGYRVLLAEAGAVGHALHLGARALGLRTRAVHSFYDDRVERLIGVDGVDEVAVGLHLLGPVEPDGGR
jgi:SagB-type dehydrogenase family enzyme